MDAPFAPKSHLDRARVFLSTGKLSDMFHCALELRFAIEGRLLQYSEFAANVKENKGSLWRSKELAKHVNDVFAGDQTVWFITFASPKLQVPRRLVFVPVTPLLRELHGKLDNFLHALGARACWQESEHDRFHRLVVETIDELKFVLAGELHGPPLTKHNGEQIVTIEIDHFPEMDGVIKAGDAMEVGIEQLSIENARLRFSPA